MAPSDAKAICTVASQSHIGQFLVLVDSILDHEPGLAVFLLVIDLAPDEAGPLRDRIAAYLKHGDRLALTVLTLDELYGATADQLRFCYDPFELCNIARGGLHKWLHDRTALERWLYLDGDMVCFGPLDPIFAAFADHDLLLSAHRAQPCKTGEEDLILLMYGAYNGGLFGVQRGPVAQRFVDWFFDRMLRYGRADARLPLSLQPHQRFAFFADQTWLALVPMYFDRVGILKARGFNCGPWSVEPDDRYEPAEGGGIRLGPDQVTLLHLSGWSADQPNRLAYYLPHDFTGNAWWQGFMADYLPSLARARQEFHRPYRYAAFADGTPITPYQRRAYLKLELSGRHLDASPFERRAAVEGLAADFDTYDYVAPGLQVVRPDAAFPNMIEANRHRIAWPYLRKEVPHKWYADIRNPDTGFVSRDEAMLIHNTARLFSGKPALEIGCWMGWSACHLALGGVTLDVIDPLLADATVRDSVAASLTAAGVMDRCTLHARHSPAAIRELAEAAGKRWNLIFIDGDHQAPAPLHDAMAAEQFAASDAILLFHDLACPDVAQALAYLRSRGWQTMIYLTMQIMGVAWRGNVTPVRHVPDPNVTWHVPPWLSNFRISQ